MLLGVAPAILPGLRAPLVDRSGGALGGAASNIIPAPPGVSLAGQRP